MKRNQGTLLIFACLLVILEIRGYAKDEKQLKPNIYELQIAQYTDTFGKTPQYVYVVGADAFRSLDDLKKFIRLIPKGSALEWKPSCRGPSFLSQQQEEELKVICNIQQVKFVHVPSG